jgi:hypothetical protein
MGSLVSVCDSTSESNTYTEHVTYLERLFNVLLRHFTPKVAVKTNKYSQNVIKIGLKNQERNRQKKVIRNICKTDRQL